MYYCRDCGNEFEYPVKSVETHGIGSPPYEERYVCPSCRGTGFNEMTRTHCRCCGARIFSEGDEYCCDECAENGRRMWLREMKRRRSTAADGMALLIRELEGYNKKHGTRYSYGQYVALVRGGKRGQR